MGVHLRVEVNGSAPSRLKPVPQVGPYAIPTGWPGRNVGPASAGKLLALDNDAPLVPHLGKVLN